MLDPLTALGLAASIVQFVDFGGKIVLTASKIYRSGTTKDGLDTKLVSENIITLKNKIESGLVRPLTSGDDQLLELGKQCVETADEIVALFRSASAGQAKPGILIATKAALRLVWKQDEIERLKSRLAFFREQFGLHILVELRETIKEAELTKSERYLNFDARTQEFLKAVSEQRNVFVETMKMQLEEIKDLHQVTRNSIIDENGTTRSVLVAELKVTTEANVTEHQKTRVELQESVVLEATLLRKEMERLRYDIQRQIEVAVRRSGRGRVYETSSQASRRDYEMSQYLKHLNAAWYAKDIKLSDLMSRITTDQLDGLTALLDGQQSATSGTDFSDIVAMNKLSEEVRSTPPHILGSNVLNFGTTFNIDEEKLNAGARKLDFISAKSVPMSMKIALSNRFTLQQINGWQDDMRLAMNSVEPFFFAGSFLFPSILRIRTNGASLQGLAASMTPATLRGYHAFVVKDATWPALSPTGLSTCSTDGMLVFGLRDSQRQSLLDFQGGMFDIRFEEVEVKLADDGSSPTKLKAACFVWNGTASALVSLRQAKWSVEKFMTTSFYEDLSSIIAQEEETLTENVLRSGRANRTFLEPLGYRPRHGLPQSHRFRENSRDADFSIKKKKMLMNGKHAREERAHSIYMRDPGRPETRCACGGDPSRYFRGTHYEERHNEGESFDIASLIMEDDPIDLHKSLASPASDNFDVTPSESVLPVPFIPFVEKRTSGTPEEQRGIFSAPPPLTDEKTSETPLSRPV